MAEADRPLRSNARELRRTVATFAPSPLRRAGLLIGAAIILLMTLCLVFLSEREVRLSCTRDDAGAGRCERTLRYVTRTQSDSFDVRALRGARLERSVDKAGRDVYRVHLVLATGQTPLGPASRDATQIEIQRAVERFAGDPSARSLDAGYDGGWPSSLFGFSIFFIAGLGMMGAAWFGTHVRRLVLSEDDGTVRLERRVFVRWRTIWQVPLADAERLRVEKTPPGPRGQSDDVLVLDTRSDGPLVVHPDVVANDPAIAEARDFLSVDR